MKKLVFGLSIGLNILLFTLFIYQMSRPKKSLVKDNSRSAFLSLQRQMPVNYGDIVFLGGQQVMNCPWSELLGDCRVKNRGIPTAFINNEKVRLNSLLQNAPSQLFLLLGIDDLNEGVSPEIVLDDYKKLIDFIRQKSPMTEMIVLSVLPINSGLSNFPLKVTTAEIETLNRELKKYVLDNGIVFLNLYNDFSDEKGVLRSSYSAGDGFSLNSSGYFLWKERIQMFMR